MNIEFSWFMVFYFDYDILTTIGPDGLIFVNFIRGSAGRFVGAAPFGNRRLRRRRRVGNIAS